MKSLDIVVLLYGILQLNMCIHCYMLLKSLKKVSVELEMISKTHGVSAIVLYIFLTKGFIKKKPCSNLIVVQSCSQLPISDMAMEQRLILVYGNTV